jgi:hypothetical protein
MECNVGCIALTAMQHRLQRQVHCRNDLGIAAFETAIGFANCLHHAYILSITGSALSVGVGD